jgi:tetratricopeptide (TPR) repeat protein
MRRAFLTTVLFLAAAAAGLAQEQKLVIPAGTPEDQALQDITKEPDAAKKAAMYEDFVQKFSGTPAAVAYGNWQLAQYYQQAGDLPKALSYGDKALAAAPNNLDILVSQTGIAQQAKDDAKVIEYATRAGIAYNALAKQPKPAAVSDDEFKSQVSEAQTTYKNSYDFAEAAAYNAIADEKDANTRMSYIEKFSTAFPNSRFEDAVTSYAEMSLSTLKDTPRLIAYCEKTLAANPKSLPSMLLLADTYAEDSKPGSLTKSVSYAQKAIEVANADAPDADKSRKVYAGAAHSTLGNVYMKQDKTAAAIPELKTAASLLKGQDDQSYARALYLLGFAYAKLNRVAEAKEVLNEAVKIQGPIQQPAQELLAKVNSAKARK